MFIVCCSLVGCLLPLGSMYGIFTYIWLIFVVNLGKYTNPMDPLVGWLPMRAARCCCFTTRNHLRSGSFPSAQQPIWRLGNAIPEKGWVPNRANGLEVLFPAQNRGIYCKRKSRLVEFVLDKFCIESWYGCDSSFGTRFPIVTKNHGNVRVPPECHPP